MLAIQEIFGVDRLPVDFRQQIRDGLRRLNKSVYWLSTQVPAIGRTTLYDYLREKDPTEEIGSAKLAAILEAIEREEARQQEQK